MTSRGSAALVCGLVLFAFYFPSSTGGVISQPLTVVALIVTCIALGALASRRRGLGRPSAVLSSGVLIAVLVAATIISPFEQISPGLLAIYLALALLFALNLRDVSHPRLVFGTFLAINVISVVLGILITLDVTAADTLLKTYYQAFRPDLLHSMLDLSDKPVLTFATHSMAAFMIYLLLLMSLRTFTAGGSRWWLAVVAVHLVLLVALTATTSYLFLGVAIVQILAVVGRRRPALVYAVVVIALLAIPFALVASGVRAVDVADELTFRLIGDEVHGFVARYASEGLLATNFRYLLQHPLQPIGFDYSDALYLGDSGVIVTMLRGSVPLLLATYGGLFFFLRWNLQSRRMALWLWVVIVAFEVGFTPLQYFRFTGFLPFAVVYFNSISAGTTRASTDTRESVVP